MAVRVWYSLKRNQQFLLSFWGALSSFLAQPWERGEQEACVNWGVSAEHSGSCGSKMECQKHWELDQNVSRLKIGRLEEGEDGLSSG